MKFAQIGYGYPEHRKGNDDGGRNKGGYTYLVNDNVRKEQIMQVISTSRNGRAFPTTGEVLTVTAAQPSGAPPEPTRAYTQKELGVKGGFGVTAGERQAETRYKALSVYNNEVLGGLTGEAAEKKMAITGGTKTEALMKNEGYETYEDYVKRTGGFGENG